MRRRLVLWGSNAQEEKILLGLELLDKENKVKLLLVPENVATEEFYNQMMNAWRNDQDILFPATTIEQERNLSVADDLLPEDIKVDRTDLILRAKAEWHFVVLSDKLYEIYKSEIEDLKETVENLKEYDGSVWDELRNFWGKVHEQVKDKNIFREHAESLKNKTNEAFDKLKVLKKEVENKFKEESKSTAKSFMDELAEIEGKIEKGLGLKPIFEELKSIQNKFREREMTRKDKNSVWGKMDSLFKVVKEKKYGNKPKTGNTNSTDRLSRRYQGLISAIDKMENSIKRDRHEMDFQNKRISQTDGQLESQIRQAKIQMIEARVSSKQEKLDDMLKTRIELEARIVQEKIKVEKQKEKAEIEKAKKAIKEKIAAEISESSLDAETTEKLEKAAEEIKAAKASKKKKEPKVEVDETPTETASETVSETQSEEASGTPSEQPSETVSGTPPEEENKSAKANEEPTVLETAGAILSSLKESLTETLEDAVDTVKAVAEVVEDKVEDFIEDMNKDEEE